MKIKHKLPLCGLGVIVVGAPIATSISFATNSQDNDEFSYKGRIFKDTEEAYTYLVKNNMIKIGSQKVLGDLTRSYRNIDDGQLIKNNLPNYNIGDIDFAYFNAGGGLAKYDDAKHTYYNPGMVVSRFDDGFGHSFRIEGDAKNSMKEHSIPGKIEFYNVDYVLEDGSYVKKRINPYNKKDITNYKENIKNHFFQIVANYLKNPDDDLCYKVEPANKNNLSGTEIILKANDLMEGIKPILKDKFSSGKTIQFANNNSFTIKEKASISPKYYSDWKIIGDWLWNETYEENHPNGMSFKYNFDHDPHFWWTDNLQNLEYFKNSANDADALVDVLKSSKWIEVEQNEDDLKSIIEKDSVKNELDETIKNIKNNIVSLNVLDKILKNYPLVKQKYIYDEIKFKLSSSLQAHFDLVEPSKSSYKITKRPCIETKEKDTGTLGIDNAIKVVKNEYTFNYTEALTTTINDIVLKDDSSSPSWLLEKSLFDWKSGNDNNSKKFIIEVNKRPLFDITLNLNSSGAPVVKSIEIDPQNKKGVYDSAEDNDSSFEGKDFKTTILDKIIQESQGQDNKNKTLQNYLMWMYNKFYKEIEEIRNKNLTDKIKYNNTFDIYDRFFGDKEHYFGQWYNVLKDKPNLKYDADFDNSEPNGTRTIKPLRLMQMYANTLNSAYQSYKEQKPLLFLLSKELFDPSATFIYSNKENDSALLGRYNIKSITDFNASLMGDSPLTNNYNFATNKNIWNIVKENIKFNPESILIAYDNNANEINAGSYQYDDEVLLEYNAHLNVGPRRDYDHVFITSHPGEPVVNQVETIYSLGIDGEILWFDSFLHLKNYMVKLIYKNARKL